MFRPLLPNVYCAGTRKAAESKSRARVRSSAMPLAMRFGRRLVPVFAESVDIVAVNGSPDCRVRMLPASQSRIRYPSGLCEDFPNGRE